MVASQRPWQYTPSRPCHIPGCKSPTRLRLQWESNCSITERRLHPDCVQRFRPIYSSSCCLLADFSTYRQQHVQLTVFLSWALCPLVCLNELNLAHRYFWGLPVWPHGGMLMILLLLRWSHEVHRVTFNVQLVPSRTGHLSNPYS